MRPTDLAREHGLSTQAVRNYERDGFLPAADRTPSGYRVYTPLHAAALRAYLALVPAYGHRTAGCVMTAIHAGLLDQALAAIDRGHAQLVRDRETLAAVHSAVEHLAAEPDSSRSPRTIGELAHLLRVTPATLRKWEAAGILAPARHPITGYRVFTPGDTRDAELAHLLRRGGYPLDRIAAVVGQIRAAADPAAFAATLADWQRRLTARALSMLHASTRLSHYVALRDSARSVARPVA